MLNKILRPATITAIGNYDTDVVNSAIKSIKKQGFRCTEMLFDSEVFETLMQELCGDGSNLRLEDDIMSQMHVLLKR